MGRKFSGKGYETVLSDGSAVWCNKDERMELYSAIPFSYGTLGFLTAVDLVKAYPSDLRGSSFVRNTEQHWAENTHLQGKGKYHCTAALLFDWLGFRCLGYVELYRDFQVWSNPNQSNWRSVILPLTKFSLLGVDNRVLSLYCVVLKTTRLGIVDILGINDKMYRKSCEKGHYELWKCGID